MPRPQLGLAFRKQLTCHHYDPKTTIVSHARYAAEVAVVTSCDGISPAVESHSSAEEGV